jgi:hypothetical protein
VGNPAGERPDRETNQTGLALPGREAKGVKVWYLSTAAQRRGRQRSASIEVERGLICGYHPVQRKGKKNPTGRGASVEISLTSSSARSSSWQVGLRVAQPWPSSLQIPAAPAAAHPDLHWTLGAGPCLQEEDAGWNGDASWRLSLSGLRHQRGRRGSRGEGDREAVVEAATAHRR